MEIFCLSADALEADKLRLDQAPKCMWGVKTGPMQQGVGIGFLEKDFDVELAIRTKGGTLENSGI